MTKTFIGIVSSDKADKTIVVSVENQKTHPVYKKQYTVNNSFMAHDEKNEAALGDTVSIVETKPRSKKKRFALETVISRAPIQHQEQEA